MDTRAISLVETTSSDENTLNKIAKGLVEQRLAACVQILPAQRSVYRWQGEMEESTEFRLQAKTVIERVAQVIDFVKAHHNYQLPEIAHTALNVTEEYAQWVVEETLPS